MLVTVLVTVFIALRIAELSKGIMFFFICQLVWKLQTRFVFDIN